VFSRDEFVAHEASAAAASNAAADFQERMTTPLIVSVEGC
jgi:hypothetical protein